MTQRKKKSGDSATPVKPPSSPRALDIKIGNGKTEAEVLGQMVVDPSINAATTIQTYQDNVLGPDVSMMSTIGEIRSITERIKGGDLSDLEGMLVSQAISLQTMFTSLSRRAQIQGQQRNLEAFLGLAFKAQAQSRSTIQALIDLKFPRQVAFVKQTNIAGGHQQVNNGMPAPAQEIETPQSKILEPSNGEWMDARAPGAAGRIDPHVEALGQGNRTQKPARKSRRVA